MKDEKFIGKVKVRMSSRSQGASLEVTIPSEACIFFPSLKKKDVLYVYINEKEGKIIYRLNKK